MIYDITPDLLFETSEVLDEQQRAKLQEARDEYHRRIHLGTERQARFDHFGRPTGEYFDLPAGLTRPAKECSDIAAEIARRFGGRIVRDPHARAIETQDEYAWVRRVNSGEVRDHDA